MEASSPQTEPSPWAELAVHRVPSEEEDRLAELIFVNYRVSELDLRRPFWRLETPRRVTKTYFQALGIRDTVFGIPNQVAGRSQRDCTWYITMDRLDRAILYRHQLLQNKTKDATVRTKKRKANEGDGTIDDNAATETGSSTQETPDRAVGKKRARSSKPRAQDKCDSVNVDPRVGTIEIVNTSLGDVDSTVRNEKATKSVRFDEPESQRTSRIGSSPPSATPKFRAIHPAPIRGPTPPSVTKEKEGKSPDVQEVLHPFGHTSGDSYPPNRQYGHTGLFAHPSVAESESQLAISPANMTQGGFGIPSPTVHELCGFGPFLMAPRAQDPTLRAPRVNKLIRASDIDRLNFKDWQIPVGTGVPSSDLHKTPSSPPGPSGGFTSVNVINKVPECPSSGTLDTDRRHNIPSFDTHGLKPYAPPRMAQPSANNKVGFSDRRLPPPLNGQDRLHPILIRDSPLSDPNPHPCLGSEDLAPINLVNEQPRNVKPPHTIGFRNVPSSRILKSQPLRLDHQADIKGGRNIEGGKAKDSDIKVWHRPPGVGETHPTIFRLVDVAAPKEWERAQHETGIAVVSPPLEEDMEILLRENQSREEADKEQGKIRALLRHEHALTACWILQQGQRPKMLWNCDYNVPNSGPQGTRLSVPPMLDGFDPRTGRDFTEPPPESKAVMTERTMRSWPCEGITDRIIRYIFEDNTHFDGPSAYPDADSSPRLQIQSKEACSSGRHYGRLARTSSQPVRF
ncbi:MAG: hypothetical protein Q9169_002148 [Polycauliona sp. 2 TL-2023]